MSSKRSSTGAGNVFPSRKRRKARTTEPTSDEVEATDLSGPLPNDTKAALQYLRAIFPVVAFQGSVPAILLKHQLYCVVQDKTIVDRQLNELWEKNEVRLFKLVSGSDEFAVMLMDDYDVHLRSKVTTNTTDTIDKFLKHILPRCIDVSFSRTTLMDQHGLIEDEITHLISLGVLTVRDVGSWWLSIPGVGRYMKNLSKGRKALLRIIKNTKYKEIFQNELESRTLSTHSKLGMKYHLYDIIGAELVQRIDTTSGQLLRLQAS